jgi:hypothetical protein
LPHPLELAHRLVATHGPPCSAQTQALEAIEAIEAMLEYCNRDERVCKDCEATFYVTPAMAAYYAANALHEPVRCQACRTSRRQARG